MTSESLGNLAAALAKAQAEFEDIKKDKTNPHWNSKYVSLEGCIKPTRPALTKYELAVSQALEMQNDRYVLVTRLLHSSGEFIDSTLPLLLQKQDMQGLAGACTYARRTEYACIVGVAPDEDDDGESNRKSFSEPATRRASKPKSAPAKPKPDKSGPDFPPPPPEYKTSDMIREAETPAELKKILLSKMDKVPVASDTKSWLKILELSEKRATGWGPGHAAELTMHKILQGCQKVLTIEEQEAFTSVAVDLPKPPAQPTPPAAKEPVTATQQQALDAF